MLACPNDEISIRHDVLAELANLPPTTTDADTTTAQPQSDPRKSRLAVKCGCAMMTLGMLRVSKTDPAPVTDVSDANGPVANPRPAMPLNKKTRDWHWPLFLFVVGSALPLLVRMATDEIACPQMHTVGGNRRNECNTTRCRRPMPSL